MPKLFSADSERYTVAHESDDGIILETRQDVSQIVEANKRQMNESSGKYEDVITHVARLPLTVIDDQIGRAHV